MISAASSASTMPSLSVVHAVPSRRSNVAPALSSPQKPRDPSPRPAPNLVEPPAELRAHPIDHAAAHDGLPDPGVRAPLRPVLEEMVDGDGEIVIGRQQPRAARDDPMPIVIGIAGEGDIEAVPQAD